MTAKVMTPKVTVSVFKVPASAEYQYYTARVVPEPCIITQSLETGTIIGGTGSKFIKHFA